MHACTGAPKQIIEGRRAGPGPTGGWDYSSRGPGNGIVHAENLCMIYIAGGGRGARNRGVQDAES